MMMTTTDLDRPFFQDEFDLNTRDPETFKRIAKLQRDIELKHNKIPVVEEIKKLAEDSLARNDDGNAEVVKIISRRIGSTLQRLRRERDNRHGAHGLGALLAMGEAGGRLRKSTAAESNNGMSPPPPPTTTTASSFTTLLRRTTSQGGDFNPVTPRTPLVPNSPLAMRPTSWGRSHDELDELKEYLSSALKRHPDREERVTFNQCIKADAMRVQKVMNEDWNPDISYEMWLQNQRTLSRARFSRLRWMFLMLIPTAVLNVALAVALFATIPLSPALLLACAVLFYIQAVGVVGTTGEFRTGARGFVCVVVNLLAGTTCAVVGSRGKAIEDPGAGTGVALSQIVVAIAYSLLLRDFSRAHALI